MNDQMMPAATVEPFEDLVSVPDAARLLRVSESTLWRWINEDFLPSYRVGRKRIYLKRGELTPLLKPARTKGGEMVEKERNRLNLYPMNPNWRPDIDPVEQALALHAMYLAAHAGKPMAEGWEDINESRDQRTRELDPDPPA